MYTDMLLMRIQLSAVQYVHTSEYCGAHWMRIKKSAYLMYSWYHPLLRDIYAKAALLS